MAVVYEGANRGRLPSAHVSGCFITRHGADERQPFTYLESRCSCAVYTRITVSLRLTSCNISKMGAIFALAASSHISWVKEPTLSWAPRHALDGATNIPSTSLYSEPVVSTKGSTYTLSGRLSSRSSQTKKSKDGQPSGASCDPSLNGPRRRRMHDSRTDTVRSSSSTPSISATENSEAETRARSTPPVMDSHDQDGERPVRRLSVIPAETVHAKSLMVRGHQKPARCFHPVRSAMADTRPRMAACRSNRTVKSALLNSETIESHSSRTSFFCLSSGRGGSS